MFASLTHKQLYLSMAEDPSVKTQQELKTKSRGPDEQTVAARRQAGRRYRLYRTGLVCFVGDGAFSCQMIIDGVCLVSIDSNVRCKYIRMSSKMHSRGVRNAREILATWLL